MAVEYTRQQVNKLYYATINIPYHLRNIVGGKKQVNLPVDRKEATVKSILDVLFAVYPPLKQSIVDENGNISSFLGLYLNDINVKKLDNLNTRLEKTENEISFRPAIAGG